MKTAEVVFLSLAFGFLGGAYVGHHARLSRSLARSLAYQESQETLLMGVQRLTLEIENCWQENYRLHQQTDGTGKQVPQGGKL